MIMCEIHDLSGVMLVLSSLSEITYHVHHGYHVDNLNPHGFYDIEKFSHFTLNMFIWHLRPNFEILSLHTFMVNSLNHKIQIITFLIVCKI